MLARGGGALESYLTCERGTRAGKREGKTGRKGRENRYGRGDARKKPSSNKFGTSGSPEGEGGGQCARSNESRQEMRAARYMKKGRGKAKTKAPNRNKGKGRRHKQKQVIYWDRKVGLFSSGEM